MTKLINEWSSILPNQDIWFKASMVMLSLILQRTSDKCRTSEIKPHDHRRLGLRNKDIESLLNEMRLI